MNCDESKCQILVEPPETPSPNLPPPSRQQPIAPPVTTTSTTTTSKPPIRTDTQGNEKGPSQSELAYYASRLTDANINAQKGPPDAMSYYPEQFQYMQAQGTPGLRGPPGPAGPAGPAGQPGLQGKIKFK